MKKVLIGAHTKFEREQHTEINLLGLNKQYKAKIKWFLNMVSKHVLLYIHLPDYKSSCARVVHFDSRA